MSVDRLTKKIGIIVTIIFIIAYFSFKYWNEKTNLNGVWNTNEKDGVNFSLIFFKKDSLKIINGDGDFKFYKYKIDGKQLSVFEDEIESFGWEFKLENEKLTITDDKSLLVLYKTNN